MLRGSDAGETSGCARDDEVMSDSGLREENGDKMMAKVNIAVMTFRLRAVYSARTDHLSRLNRSPVTEIKITCHGQEIS